MPTSCKQMKILHVWDECGIAGMISKEFRKRGIVCDVIKRYGFDTGLFQDSYYGTELIVNLISPPATIDDASFKRKIYSRLPSLIKKIVWRFFNLNRALCFYVEVAKKARHYDILHIHSVLWVTFFVPFKPKIFLFHGDDIRRSPSFMTKRKKLVTRLMLKILSLTNKIYVSTSDLVNESSNSEWVPNPVDDEMFKPLTPNVNPKGHALYFLNWFDNIEWATEQAKKNGWQLTILHRNKQEFVQYIGMPRLLSYFEFFIDRTNIKSLSKTALEALACGLKVVQYDGKIIKGLPPSHNLDVVVNKWLSRYKEKLKK